MRESWLYGLDQTHHQPLLTRGPWRWAGGHLRYFPNGHLGLSPRHLHRAPNRILTQVVQRNNKLHSERFSFVLVLLWTDRGASPSSHYQPNEKPLSTRDKVATFQKMACATLAFDRDSESEISSLWGLKKTHSLQRLSEEGGLSPTLGLSRCGALPAVAAASSLGDDSISPCPGWAEARGVGSELISPSLSFPPPVPHEVMRGQADEHTRGSSIPWR